MTDAERFKLLSLYLVVPAEEKQMALDRMLDAMPLVRIAPGPPSASPLILARIRYQLTGLRQWIVPPALEPPC